MARMLWIWAALLAPAALCGGPVRIVAEKPEKDYALTPLEFEIRGVPENFALELRSVPGGQEVPCQITKRSAESLTVVWVAEELKTGTEPVWEVYLIPIAKAPKPVIEARKVDADAIDVLIEGKQFTRLEFGPDLAKPYLFPIIGPNGKMITRQYPMKEVEGEKQDHPHQRSLWFTHGAVGGVDFWAEGKGCGKIRQVSVDAMESGPVFSRIVTSNEWVGPDGKKILDDKRTLTFYPLPRGEKFIDVSLTLTSAGGPVVFGDTKEGTFGIRLAESMREDRKDRGGKVVNSRGRKGTKEAWGKPAEWVDYDGLVEGDTVGVAILDHPKSFRHPTHWHVRDYGLFAANPFGYKEFGEKEKGEGKYTLEPGKTMEFRYRVYLHGGTTEAARVAEVYSGFASPPALHPRAVKDEK
jgi:hypothetical protein